MDEGLVKIILALISLLGTIITVVLVPYIKTKTTAEQRANTYSLVMLAVQAAEQIFFQPGKGKEKKEYVINYLYSRGIKLTVEDVDLLIEAAVKELNLIQEQLLPPNDALV